MASKKDLLKKKNPPQRRPHKEDVGSLSLVDNMIYEEELRIKKQIRIHEELKPYIPPLREEEFARLEQNILEDGEVREKLLVWQTPDKEYFLLDGHHRYQIINKHAQRDLNWGIEVKKDLADIHEAKRFMRNLQFGRRNLTANQMAYLRGRTYHDLKQESAGRPDAEKATTGKTKDLLAVEFKVGTSQIQRDAWFCKAIDRFRDEQLPEEIQGEADHILLNESDFLKGEIELLGKHLDFPMELAYSYKKAGGDLRNIARFPDKERILAVEAFLNEGTAPQKSEPKKSDKAEKKTAPSSPADRFEKWWTQQRKDLGKVFKSKNPEAIQAKKQELLAQAEKINELLKEFEQV